MQDTKIKSIVAVKKCNTYKKDQLLKKIQESLDLVGGLKKYIRSAKKILLKPNLLSATEPENAVTTHPVFIECIVELIKKPQMTMLA